MRPVTSASRAHSASDRLTDHLANPFALPGRPRPSRSGGSGAGASGRPAIRFGDAGRGPAGRGLRLFALSALLAVVPALATFGVFTTANASTYFSDGFESGTFSGWSVAKGGYGTATIESSVVKSGSYAASLTSTQTTGSYSDARATLGTPLQTATVSADVRVTAEGPVNYNVPLLQSWASDGNFEFDLYRQNQDYNQVWIKYGGAYNSTTGTLPLNTWAHVDVAVAINGGSTSTISVWLNGTLIHSRSGVSLGNNWLQTIQLGNQLSGEAFGIDVDNVTVTNTYGPSGTSATPSPTPTATPTSTATPTPTPTSTTSGVPAFSHVYLIVMENKEYGDIVGNSAAPYENWLISKYGLATNYYAITHPSEPNYYTLFSGSTQGVTDDGTYNLSGTNLVDQLESHGKSWREFAQNVPLGCYTGTSASGGEDGTGSYVRRHAPPINFTDISGNSTRCAKITDFTHFDPAAANFELIIPNLCNDMHDCSVSTGDNFLKGFIPKITGSSAFTNSVIFLTWDEGTTNTNGGGHVATIVISPLTKAGTKSSTWHNHYSLLHTIENAWGLGCLNNTCNANDLRELFG